MQIEIQNTLAIRQRLQLSRNRLSATAWLLVCIGIEYRFYLNCPICFRVYWGASNHCNWCESESLINNDSDIGKHHNSNSILFKLSDMLQSTLGSVETLLVSRLPLLISTRILVSIGIKYWFYPNANWNSEHIGDQTKIAVEPESLVRNGLAIGMYRNWISVLS